MINIEDIIQGCKEGNRKCQDALVQKFAPGLLSLCIRYTSDRDLAQDALQECFINAFKYISKFEGKGSFEGWLRRIAVTQSIAINKKFRQVHFEEMVENDKWQYAEIPDIYGTMQKEEIMALMQKLPESLYLVFNMAVIEGYNHQEISTILGITESTSRSALCKARNRMVELINKNEISSLAKVG